MTQQLFPIKVKSTIVNPFSSADMTEIAIGEDDMDYAVKKGVTAACESLCYNVFAACSIGVPQSSILIMPDGSFAFGSRIIIDQTYASADPVEKMQWYKDCGNTMSAICGLDFMLANEDRHTGNFLFITALNARKTCMAIDFSRALLYLNWPLSEIWLAINNTTNLILAKKQLGSWDVSSATQSLLALASIKQATWSSWVNNLPDDWLDMPTRTELSNWWGSNEFQSRIQKCMIAIQ